MWQALEARHIPKALGQSRDEQIRDTQTFTWSHIYSPGAISSRWIRCAWFSWFNLELKNYCALEFLNQSSFHHHCLLPSFSLVVEPHIRRKYWQSLIVGISLAKCSIEFSPCLGEPGWLVLHGGSCYSSPSFAQSQKDNKSKMTFLTSSELIQIILVNWTYEVTWANHCIKVLASRPWPTHNLIKKHWFVVKI